MDGVEVGENRVQEIGGIPMLIDCKYEAHRDPECSGTVNVLPVWIQSLIDTRAESHDHSLS